MNAGAFRNKGIEVSSSAIISKAFIFTANYSYLYTTSENLLYAPKNMLSAQLTAYVANFTVSIQSQSVWRLNNGGQHSTNYSLLNTRIAYKYKISPFVKLDNLTHKHYEIMYGCPMPGTTILCGLQTNF
jgi:outer membrane cobalamin receptor